MDEVQIRITGPGGTHGGNVQLTGDPREDRKEIAEALRAAAAYVLEGHADEHLLMPISS